MGLGTLTQAEFIPIITDALGKNLSASSLSGASLSSRVINFMNWGQERIARAYRFDELNLTTLDNSPDGITPGSGQAHLIASTYSYNMLTAVASGGFGLVLPMDISSITVQNLENSSKLEKIDRRDFNKRFPYPPNFATQMPRMYSRWGYVIKIFRIPDQNYPVVIEYPAWPTPFTISNTTQTSDFDHKDQLIITAAVVEGYLHLEMYDDAKIWLQRLIGLLEDAIHACGDVDWEPHQSEFKLSKAGYTSGEPWLDPYAVSTDPLYGYSG